MGRRQNRLDFVGALSVVLRLRDELPQGHPTGEVCKARYNQLIARSRQLRAEAAELTYREPFRDLWCSTGSP